EAARGQVRCVPGLPIARVGLERGVAGRDALAVDLAHRVPVPRFEGQDGELHGVISLTASGAPPETWPGRDGRPEVRGTVGEAGVNRSSRPGPPCPGPPGNRRLRALLPSCPLALSPSRPRAPPGPRSYFSACSLSII